MKRNLEIDRLRAIAALIVVSSHLLFIYYPGLLSFANGFATTIIDLTFVISGYVISCVLVKQIDQLKGNDVNLIAYLKSFLVKRIFRIYPPLWAVFFLVLFFCIFVNSSNVFGTPFNMIQSSVMLLTSTYNFFFISSGHSMALGPYWSLTIEEQFYLTFPIFLLLTRNNRQRVQILIGMIVLITFVLRPLTLYYYDFGSLFFTQTRCDALMYGCLIYILTQQPWFDHLKPSLDGNRWLRMTFIVLLLSVIISLSGMGYSPAVYLPINSILCSLLLITAIFEQNFVWFPSMIQKTLDILAPRSYSLYVIHFPIILLANQIFQRYGDLTLSLAIQKTIATLILILISNEILYRLVLKPSLKMGKKISSSIIENAKRNPPDGSMPLAK